MEYITLSLPESRCWFVADSPPKDNNLFNLLLSDLGRILAGIQVPVEDGHRFDTFLRTLGYPNIEETNNPVYRRFLRA